MCVSADRKELVNKNNRHNNQRISAVSALQVTINKDSPASFHILTWPFDTPIRPATTRICPRNLRYCPKVSPARIVKALRVNRCVLLRLKERMEHSIKVPATDGHTCTQQNGRGNARSSLQRNTTDRTRTWSITAIITILYPVRRSLQASSSALLELSMPSKHNMYVP